MSSYLFLSSVFYSNILTFFFIVCHAATARSACNMPLHCSASQRLLLSVNVVATIQLALLSNLHCSPVHQRCQHIIQRFRSVTAEVRVVARFFGVFQTYYECNFFYTLTIFSSLFLISLAVLTVSSFAAL